MLVLAYWGFDRDWAIPSPGIAVAWWALALLGLRAYPRRIPLAVVGAAGPLALLPAWFLLTHLHGNAAQGPGLTLSVLLIVWAADVGAYLVGRHWGQVKLAPRVSPGKTWEGFTGGMLLAAFIAFVAGIALELPRGPFVAVGIAAALGSGHRRSHGEHVQAQREREGQRSTVAGPTAGSWTVSTAWPPPRPCLPWG